VYYYQKITQQPTLTWFRVPKIPITNGQTVEHIHHKKNIFMQKSPHHTYIYKHKNSALSTPCLTRTTGSCLTNSAQTWKYGLWLPPAHGETSRAIRHARAWWLLCGPNWQLLVLLRFDWLVIWQSPDMMAVATMVAVAVLIVLVVLIVIVLLVTTSTPSATTSTRTATSGNFLVGVVIIDLYNKYVMCQKVCTTQGMQDK
jgi:hypothetical protein